MTAGKARNRRAPTHISKTRLAEMIREATIDAYDEGEQITGWFTVLEEHLELPFETTVLGTAVIVSSIDLRAGNQIVAICARARNRQAISLLDLPLPSPRPAGYHWIEAYRHWWGRR